MVDLSGKSVVVTRAKAQAVELVELFRRRGADVIELPMLETADPSDGGAALREAAAHADEYDWIIFTSVNAAERFPFDGQPKARVAAVGKKTKQALKNRGIKAKATPKDADAESLVEVLDEMSHDQPMRALFPSSDIARDVLPDGLRAINWQVDVVEAYRTVCPSVDESTLDAAAAADALTFASPSAVTHYLELSGDRPVPPVIACIGLTTAKTALGGGLDHVVVADSHTSDGLVAAVAREFSRIE